MGSTENAKNFPYVSFRTFQTFLETLRNNVPDRIDRSVWEGNFSGANGLQIMVALRALNLVDSNDQTLPEMERLVFATGSERRLLLKDIVERTYKPLFELDLSRATRQQFQDAFSGFGLPPHLQKKCEAFFIQIAQAGSIELSPYILKGRLKHSQKAPAPVTPPASAAPAAKSGGGTSAAATAAAAAAADSAIKREMLEKIINKYPDFDVSWDAEVQKKWFDGMKVLYDSLI